MEAALNSRSVLATDVPPNFNTIKANVSFLQFLRLTRDGPKAALRSWFIPVYEARCLAAAKTASPILASAPVFFYGNVV